MKLLAALILALAVCGSASAIYIDESTGSGSGSVSFELWREVMPSSSASDSSLPAPSPGA
jgi:hypothetical protein